MNKPQADLIYEEVLKRERQHPEPFRAFRERHPHEPLDVKNLENVQGDERDVVFISVTYGRDAGGVLRQQFGPLLTDGGERRLNVLITRARRRCEVFSNLTADDIRGDALRAGVSALQRYLRFAATGFFESETAASIQDESPFSDDVVAALREHGFEAHRQVGSEGYRIDIGVLDPSQPGRYLLGVEYDGRTYHDARSARDRDKLRQRVLEARGWRLHRIWSHDWWQDRDGEVQRLLDALEIPTEAEAVVAETPVVSIQEVEREEGPPATARPYVEAPPAEPPVDLAAYLRTVVEVEGPIHEDLLFVRLRDGGGYSRAGSSVRAMIEGVIEAGRDGVKRIGDAYYDSEAQLQEPRDWSDRPIPEKRHDYVTEVEIEAAFRQIIGPAFGVNAEDAIKGAFNLMGFKRVTETAFAKGVAILNRMVEGGHLTRRDDGAYFPK